MTPSECAILNYFRRYDIGPSEMLFFNPNDCKLPMAPFNSAMESLLRRGLVVQERHKLAYSLTTHGYELSLALERQTAKKAALTRGRAVCKHRRNSAPAF
jgi:DNA-binding IclR family transcriptional regulator